MYTIQVLEITFDGFSFFQAIRSVLFLKSEADSATERERRIWHMKAGRTLTAFTGPYAHAESLVYV